MTPSVAASLIREAARGWTSAELAQFYAEVKDLYCFQMSLELAERYAEGHTHGHDDGYRDGRADGYDDGYDDGYADGEGDAETRSFDAALEDSTDN